MYSPGSFPVSPGSGAPGPMAGPYGVPLPANGPPASSSRGKVGLVVGIVVGVLVLGGVAGAAFMLRRTERDVAAPKAVGAGAAVEAGAPGVATSVEPSAAVANVASAPAGSSAPRGQTVSRDGGAKPSPSAAPSGSGLAPVPVPSGGKSLGFDPTRTTRPCTTEAQCASDQFCDKDVGFCVCARGNPSNMAGLWCGDRCVAQTPKVCGACGTSCAATENCALPPGSWVGKCTDCTGRGASYAVCGNSCSNTDRDVANCGRCRHNCFTDAICKGKTCLCQQGQCVPH